MNSDAELAAARQAHANAMTAAAQHQNVNEQRMHESSSNPGRVFVEQPQTMDDTMVNWSGSGSSPPPVPPYTGHMTAEP
jgi:hypothetical protein